MNVKIKFLGAAQTVTGSKYVLDIDDTRLMVDCGLFQGRKELRQRNWESSPVDATKIQAVILTHAHIDHSGYLPKLVSEGFRGPIYCTEATGDLLEIMLLDAAKLQEEEAEWAAKKGYSKHMRPKPLFTTKDAKKALSSVQTYPYEQPVTVNGKVSASFFNAGHILGSAMVMLEELGSEQTKKILFSGDIGPKSHAVLADPYEFDMADVLLIESTYGDREPEPGDPARQLAEVVNEAIDRGGCLLIPSFAVGRTQTLTYYLKTLFEAGSIPDIPVYIDSPMAISTTELYRKHHRYHTLRKKDAPSIFDYKNFHYYRSQEASISLNNVKRNAIIISASGMCSGGRILHHLYHRLPRYDDTVLFVGYQAEATRGRKILEGDEVVHIFGMEVPVRCHVRQIHGLSAHAGKSEMLEWLGNFKAPPKRTFVVHGEPSSSYHFGRSIRKMGWKNVIVPEYMESFELFDHI